MHHWEGALREHGASPHIPLRLIAATVVAISAACICVVSGVGEEAVHATSRSPGPALRRSSVTVSQHGESDAPRNRGSITPSERNHIIERLGSAPVGFVANAGQADHSIRFLGAAPRAGFYATDGGMTVALGTDTASEVLTLRFVGRANPHPHITTSEPLTGTVNVLRGPESQIGLERFAVLTYEAVWPGIDVRFRVQRGILKYEFLVSRGADVGQIHLAWEGAKSLTLARDGTLRLMTDRAPLTDAAPTSFQGSQQVPTRYVLERGDRFTFKVGTYDRDRPLVIDPGLAYWTFLGGGFGDTGYGVAVDAAGAVYVTGSTASPDFPSADQPKVAPGYDHTHNGHSDVFVVKLDPRGETLVYWTFLGGAGSEDASGIAVDATGAAYVIGQTSSPDFPSADQTRVAPGYDQTYNGQGDGFVVKLDPRGERLLYWTFLGGTGNDAALGTLAVDATGAAYVSGLTDSPDFPSADRTTVAAGYDHTYNGQSDGFVVKLDPTGDTLAYWTFLGGTNLEIAQGVAVDAAGAAYVTGYTGSPDFPNADQVAPGYDHTHTAGGRHPFVLKLDPLGETLAYWTVLFAGCGDTYGRGIAVDAAGAAYVTGETYAGPGCVPSVDHPTTAPGYDQTYNGRFEAFVVKLDPLGTSIGYWTFLGGTGDDQADGIAVDAAGAAYVTGFTRSPDFPSADQPKVAAGYDQTYNGNGDTTNGDTTNGDAFVVKLDPLGETLSYWSFLGGCCANNAYGYGIAVDATGAAAYVTGETESPTFPNADQPTLAAGYDRTYNASHDAFVIKLDTTRSQPNRAPVVTNPGPQSGFQGVSLTRVMSAADADGDPLVWSAVNLPPGVSIDATSGLLSGVPTAIGVFTPVITASDLSASGETSFAWTIVSPLPGDAVPLTPSGPVATSTPGFSWSAAPLASYYLVRITDGYGGASTDVWYTPAQANCVSAAGACAVTAPRALMPGLVSWQVLTWNPYGYGHWSPVVSAVVGVDDPSVPTPAQSGPVGPIATRTPTYAWDAVQGATWYELSVTDASGVVRESWYAPADVCPAASCGVTPNVRLPIGPATWMVRAWRATGAGVWSASRGFEPADAAPGKATLVSPATAAVSTAPTYAWNAVLGTSYYLLRVIDRDNTAVDRWYRPADASCATGTGTCSVSPGASVKPGPAAFLVLTWNGSGYGPWSDQRDFSVEIADPLAVTPTPLSPASSISASNATYRWSAVSGALFYRLSVRNNGWPSAYWWFTPADAVCSAGPECAVTPPVGLQNGIAEWQIQAWTANGHGEWSAPISLTVSIPAPPAPRLIAPKGSTSASPSFTWTASAGATLYYVRVYDSAGLRVDRWLTPAQASCSTGTSTCTLNVASTLAGGAGNWQVLAWNPSGYSPWSSAFAFVIP